MGICLILHQDIFYSMETIPVFGPHNAVINSIFNFTERSFFFFLQETHMEFLEASQGPKLSVNIYYAPSKTAIILCSIHSLAQFGLILRG